MTKLIPQLSPTFQVSGNSVSQIQTQVAMVTVGRVMVTAAMLHCLNH